MLPEEQLKEVKQQIIAHIESTFPEDKKTQAVEQINSMNAEQLEQFLIQNNLIKGDGTIPESSPQQCIFCSIVFGEIPSTKVGENEKSIAVLELNPISKAHTIIIPREHVSNENQIPLEAKELAKQISEKIKKFDPKSIEVYPSNMFGHEILNILPVYENETPNSPRKKSTPEELAEIQKELMWEPENPEKKIEEEQKQPKEINEKNTWLPRRTP